jgi:hypothetical protein
MFGLGKQAKDKTYKEELFSFEYPSYMKMGSEGEMTLCFFRKKWPIGVLRMSRIQLDENPPSTEELIQFTKDTFEEEGIENAEEVVYGDLKGIKYFCTKTFNYVDDAYWPGGLVAKWQKKLPKNNELEWAMTVSNLMTMTMRYYQFGNDKVHFYFTYRHFFNQTEEGQQELDKELERVEEILKSIIIS